MISFEDFEEEIINNLRKSDLIERFYTYEYSESANLELIIKYFKESSLLDFDEFGLFIIDQDGSKVYCPEIKTSLDEKGEWISSKLPVINFDIDQGGNVRKADEAEALYCCTCVARILKEEEFKNEVLEIAKNYDFENMAPLNNGVSFRMLLNSWQDLQSVIINILISACRFRISDTKKDTEKFLRDGFSDTVAAELRELESKIRSVNFRFSQEELSPSIVKDLTKIEKLKRIDARDSKISTLIKDSPSGVLYRLLNLSTEYISPVKKKKIILWVTREVDAYINSKNNKELIRSERIQIISKIQTRILKIERNSVRKLQIEKYLKEGKDFKFPSKL